MDDARTVWALGAFGVPRIANDHRTEARARRRSPGREGGYAHRGDPSTRPTFGDTALAMVRRPLAPGREALYHGEVSDPREYLDVAMDGSDGQLARRPLVAVCAHGKHDQCCAVRGRGAVAAIAAEYPELTWECSHLGGDRFAATMLVLPEGLCYGRVDSTDPPNLVRLYLAGRLDNTFLRGRTSLPHAVQAAQYFAREVSGDDRVDALSPLEVEPNDSTTRVVLQHDSALIEVIVTEQLSDPLLSKCGATVAGRVRIFALVSVSSA